MASATKKPPRRYKLRVGYSFINSRGKPHTLLNKDGSRKINPHTGEPLEVILEEGDPQLELQRHKFELVQDSPPTPAKEQGRSKKKKKKKKKDRPLSLSNKAAAYCEAEDVDIEALKAWVKENAPKRVTVRITDAKKYIRELEEPEQKFET